MTFTLTAESDRHMAPSFGEADAGLQDDAAPLDRLRRGDPQACEALVREHGGRLLAVARRFLRNEDDSADAVQEAFLSAFRAIGSFQGQAALGTWLHRIVVNACLMKLAQPRRETLSIDELLPAFDDTGHHARPVRAWRKGGAAALARQELRDLVRRSIDRLPETHREVLLLRDIEERDTEETAALLGISVGAVKVRLHRARQALRTLLEPTMEEANGANEATSDRLQ